MVRLRLPCKECPTTSCVTCCSALYIWFGLKDMCGADVPSSYHRKKANLSSRGRVFFPGSNAAGSYCFLLIGAISNLHYLFCVLLKPQLVVMESVPYIKVCMSWSKVLKMRLMPQIALLVLYLSKKNVGGLWGAEVGNWRPLHKFLRQKGSTT